LNFSALQSFMDFDHVRVVGIFGANRGSGNLVEGVGVEGDAHDKIDVPYPALGLCLIASGLPPPIHPSYCRRWTYPKKRRCSPA
jgi:hypothetical protein